MTPQKFRAAINERERLIAMHASYAARANDALIAAYEWKHGPHDDVARKKIALNLARHYGKAARKYLSRLLALKG